MQGRKSEGGISVHDTMVRRIILAFVISAAAFVEEIIELAVASPCSRVSCFASNLQDSCSCVQPFLFPLACWMLEQMVELMSM